MSEKNTSSRSEARNSFEAEPSKEGAPASRVLAAIAATREVLPGYFEKTCAQRAGLNPSAAGSVYDGASTDEVERLIREAVWEEYSHPALAPETSALRAWTPSGRLGVVELAKLDPSTPIVLDDRKGTGTVSATVKGALGEAVNFTVLILGQEQGREVVFTFHPGDPVRPSSVKTEPGLHGKAVTAAEARAMGLETAKIVS